MSKKDKTTQPKNSRVVIGKNGLRNYQFEQIQKGKRKYIEYPHHYYEWNGFFYTKKCLYCGKEFEARRVDTAFCGQACQKADIRLRKKLLPKPL